jgi:5-methylcytosine-specific restriction endonuclease McrA
MALYDSYRWQKARELFIRQNPICILCGGFSRVVDHITPHKGNVTLFWDRDNWQALCKRCHDSDKKRIEMGGHKGCNEDGIPRDHRHHWR